MIGSVVSKTGINIRLTAERWSHIVESHDYMAGNQDLVFETLENSEIIVRGRKDEFIALRHYHKTSISEKYVVVVYKQTESEGFVLTAFMTSEPEKIMRKEVVWKT